MDHKRHNARHPSKNETEGTHVDAQKGHKDVKNSENGDLIKDLQDKLAEEHDAHMRALASLDNLKKRVQREREEMRISVTSAIVEDLLPILDHFGLGLQSAVQANVDNVLSGFKMIFEQLKGILSTYGLTVIDPINQPFNPHEHDCIRREYSESQPENVVLLVMRKGYKIRDHLIRPAAVVVSTKQQV
ncbi:MAG: nucleotide exchange factor GrpE [Opitutales bacterium]|nr:nucleotide exchange factor GrpE [Opitutales bacterium]